MSSPHEHLEHAEHAGHAHDPFERRVAVSIAIVAAVLAGISMLGHRKHNEVLQLQGEANRLQTEGSILHTRATDKWGEYQAVNLRDHGYRFAGGLVKELAQSDPKLAAGLRPLVEKAKGQNEKYGSRLPTLEAEAKGLVKSAEDKQYAALGKVDDSHHAHYQADRLDYAHLGAEIGIVLCSLALLTKRRVFWLSGLLGTALAVVLSMSAYSMTEPHSPPPSGENHSH